MNLKKFYTDLKVWVASNLNLSKSEMYLQLTIPNTALKEFLINLLLQLVLIAHQRLKDSILKF